MAMLAFYLAAIETQEDRDLFTALYEEYRGFMYHIANEILEDHHAAENAVHDAFIRVIENLEKFNLKSCHKTRGLFGIVVDGLAKDEYRRRKKLSPLDDLAEDAMPSSETADECVLAQGQYESLKGHIRQLDTIYSDTLLLRHEYGFSIKEVAELTGVSEETARQRIHRAKRKLRTILEREGLAV